MSSHAFVRLRGNRTPTSPFEIAVCTFIGLYAIAALYTRAIAIRDPGSWFFDPHAAYEPRYLTVRRQQAEAYITAADRIAPLHRSGFAGPEPRICLGIPSIARAGVRYLRTTVGSLLEGLAPAERDSMHIVVFIPHSNPEVYPAYRELWLEALVDEIMVYNVSKEQMEHIVTMEQQGELFREKGLYDYASLLGACYDTGSPYIIILEDDVVAADGWYHRTMAAIAHSEKMFPRTTHTLPGFLYLRLFYPEQFLGWNSEDWPLYTFWSLATITILALLLHLIRSRSSYVERRLTLRTLIAICTIPAPLMVLLVFAAGEKYSLPFN